MAISHTLTHLYVVKDLTLTNKEGLVQHVKGRGSLGCHEHEMMEYRILKSGSKTKSWITTWTSRFLQVHQQQRKTVDASIKNAHTPLYGLVYLIKKKWKRPRYLMFSSPQSLLVRPTFMNPMPKGN